MKRGIPSGKLQEKFKFTVKVNNSHVYMQNEGDKLSGVLKNPECSPGHWIHPPSKEEIYDFKSKIGNYEKQAKHVRDVLLNKWITEVELESRQATDVVEKLNFLRKTRDNIWPCKDCSNSSNYSIIKYSQFIGLNHFSNRCGKVLQKMWI